jgi:ribosomal protein S18 acetylase RimI-like enzyme
MPSPIVVEPIKKTKKNEPKVFPSLLMVDREAFGKIEDQAYILKQFWRSSSNKIILARKVDTKAIVGYACYLELEGGCYLMRIGVRSRCQRQGIGKSLMNYMLQMYNNLSLEVSTDNQQAINFYLKMGLDLNEKYKTQDGIEFAKFDTPKDYKFPEPVVEAVQISKSAEEIKIEAGPEVKEKKIPNYEQVKQIQLHKSCHMALTPQHKRQSI